MGDDKAAETAPAARPSKTSWPIAYVLAALVIITLVPAIAFSAVLLERNNRAQQEIVETLIVGTSRAIVQAVEREIIANITTLRVLASTPSLLNHDLGAFHSQVTTALEGTGAFIYVLDDQMQLTMSTREPFTGAVSNNVSDKDSAQRALSSRDMVVSDLVFGRISKRWVINVLLPVFPPGGTPMVMGFNRDAENLSAALLSNKLPDGWSVALVDSNGLVVAASPGAAATGDTFPLVDLDTITSPSRWTQVETDSGPMQVVAQNSVLTGWRLITWAPASTVTRPLSDAVLALMVGGVLLAALVVAVVYWIVGLLGRSVRGLARDARLLGAGYVVPERDYPIAEIATVSDAIASAAQQRRRAESEVQFLMRELAHRSKNQMTVITAMAKQTARTAESVPQFIDDFQKRIFGLARSTDLLMAHGVAGVDLKELLTLQIDAFSPGQPGRIVVDGPSVRLNSQAAQTMGMAAHELATNAVKYGAFSNDSGTLAVKWSQSADMLTLNWRETTPSVVASERKGFGTKVLESMVASTLQAEVTRTLHDDGIEWHFVIPRDAIDPERVIAPEGDDTLDP